MQTNHNREDRHGAPNAIDRVAAAMARKLGTDSAAPGRDDAIDAARSWSAYLDELAWCAERNTVVGSEIPWVQLSDVLSDLHDAL